MPMKLNIPLLFLFVLIINHQAFARPEYGARYGVVNCAACHSSPFGGGSKNVYGKLFFTRSKPIGNLTPSELYSLDLRINGLFPRDAEVNNNGVAIMSTVGAAHIPVETGDPNIRTKFVGDYDFGVLGPGLRNVFVLVENSAHEPSRWLKHILVGKFNVPFGLMTDEHWSFLRLQTRTTINDFDTGVGLSGDPVERLHYDFAVTSSNTTSNAVSGKFTPGTATSPESKQGYWLNLRADLQPIPLSIGLSGMKHFLYSTSLDPWATSFYTILSFERATRGAVPVTLLFETAHAQGWNSNSYGLVSNFTSSADYLTSVEKKKSLGFSGEIQYDVLPQTLTLSYKYEKLMLDEDFGGDVFVKQNQGVKWYLTSNLNLHFRHEDGYSTVAAFKKDSSRALKEYYYIILHYWL